MMGLLRPRASGFKIVHGNHWRHLLDGSPSAGGMSLGARRSKPAGKSTVAVKRTQDRPVAASYRYGVSSSTW